VATEACFVLRFVNGFDVDKSAEPPTASGSVLFESLTMIRTVVAAPETKAGLNEPELRKRVKPGAAG